MESKEKITDTAITLVIPVYNEEDRIEESLRKIRKFMDDYAITYEVIVSDDGSKDTTREIVNEYRKSWKNLILKENIHRGKASSIISGIKAAKYPYVLFTDIDLSVPIEELPKLLFWITEKDYDIAIATREGTGAKRLNEPLTRHLMGRVFNLIVQTLVLPGINDTQCGFKLFKTDTAKAIFNKTKLYNDTGPEIEGGRVGAYDVEILFVAKKMGAKIKEVPVTWTYGDKSKVHKFKDSYINTKEVFTVKFNDLKGLYN
jgi:dolichyl-phosphate beta-glucosyltransferase